VNRVIVVSPDDTGISSARAKTDKLDARTLASLLWKESWTRGSALKPPRTSSSGRETRLPRVGGLAVDDRRAAAGPERVFPAPSGECFAPTATTPFLL
jgi:hypothetical protein